MTDSLLENGAVGMPNLADIIDVAEIQGMMDDFFGITDVAVAILDLDGKVLVTTGWQDICTRFHRVHPEACRHCTESDTILSSGVEAGTFRLYQCLNHMWDMVTPIMLGGQHAGNLFLGQFFFAGETPDREVFRAQARQYGFDEEEYLAALDRVPRWSRERINQIMTVYARFARLVSELGYGNWHLAQSLREKEDLLRSLRRNEDLLNATQRLSKVGGWEWDAEREIMFWTDELYRLHGLDPATLPDDSAARVARSMECYDPADRAAIQAAFQRCLAQGEPYAFEVHFTTRAGQRLWVRTSAQAVRLDGRVVKVIGDLMDITEPKLAEEKLRQSEEKYRYMTENSSDVIWHLDRDFRLTYISAADERLRGFAADEIIGDALWSVLKPEGIELLKAMNAQRLADERMGTKTGPAQYELEQICKDGRWIWTEVTVSPHHDSNGELVGYHGVTRDITDRKRAEAELEASRHRLKLFIDASPDMYFLKDRDLRYLLVNAANARFFGLPEEDIIGKTDVDLMPAEAAQGCAVTDLQAMAERQTVIATEEVGGRVYETRKVPVIVDGEVTGVAGIIRDITEHRRDEEERRKLQEQLNQAQKMESVGRLAGGVAHDFNNMLSVILGHAELAIEGVGPDLPLHASLLEIQKAAERSADLTRQLLAFARKQTVAPRVLDLNETVAGMLAMVRRLIGEHIDLIWSPGQTAGQVKVDPSQIDQILANLCVNARDAIADIGTITIETGSAIFDQDYCADHEGLTPGEYVSLAVRDNGCGMGKETLDRLFEPFFTTKEVGKGTGLGLATVYGIVRQNNGHVDVSSEVGQGTTVRVYLLPHREAVATLPGAGAAAPLQRGQETILLVEDEETVLRLARTMLERLGYRVLAASTPGEGFRLAREHVCEIHLLITDVIMPEMNGGELSRDLLALYPGVRCLFMSGYTADVIAHHGVLDEGVHFMAKPFSRGDLAAKVREALDGD